MDAQDEERQESVGSGSRELGRAALLAALSMLVYLPVLRAGFFSDDWQWLARMNPTLERPGYLFSVFTRDFNPMLHASFLADWLLAPGTPWLSHLHSVAIHGANAGLLYLLARRLGVGILPGVLAALTWAWNPRLSEAVVWSAARGHSLSLMLVLIALLCWSSTKRWSLAAGLAIWVLALLTKETALVPVVLLPVLLPGRWKNRRLLLGVGTTALLFVAASLALKPPAYGDGLDWEFLFLKLPFMLLRPLGLGDLYDFSWPAALLVFAAFGGALWLSRRTLALPGLLWVLLCTLPFLPLDKLSSRYLYLPAAGWGLALAGLLQLASSVKPAHRRLAGIVVGAGLVSLLSLNAWRIQLEIEDQVTISAPYQALAALARGPLSAVQSGETVVVADLSAGDAISRLSSALAQRPTMTKLLPMRPRGIDGLIEVPDLLNAARAREPGQLGYPVAAPGVAPLRVFAYDGRQFVEVREELLENVPADRLFAARWDPAERYFEAAVHDAER